VDELKSEASKSNVVPVKSNATPPKNTTNSEVATKNVKRVSVDRPIVKESTEVSETAAASSSKTNKSDDVGATAEDLVAQVSLSLAQSSLQKKQKKSAPLLFSDTALFKEDAPSSNNSLFD